MPSNKLLSADIEQLIWSNKLSCCSGNIMQEFLQINNKNNMGIINIGLVNNSNYFVFN